MFVSTCFFAAAESGKEVDHFHDVDFVMKEPQKKLIAYAVIGGGKDKNEGIKTPEKL